MQRYFQCRKLISEDFARRSMCRRAEGEKETGLLAGWDAGLRSGGNFRLLLSIRILLMKWLVTQGKIAMDGNFRKRRTGCPSFPPRPVP